MCDYANKLFEQDTMADSKEGLEEQESVLEVRAKYFNWTRFESLDVVRKVERLVLRVFSKL